MEGITILDTTGYSVFEAWKFGPLVVVSAFLTVFICCEIFIFIKLYSIGDRIAFTIVGLLCSIFVSCATAAILDSIEDKSTVKQMEVYVEDGYKFDAGFLEEWGIKKQITENVYILERRRFDGH